MDKSNSIRKTEVLGDILIGIVCLAAFVSYSTTWVVDYVEWWYEHAKWIFWPFTPAQYIAIGPIVVLVTGLLSCVVVHFATKKIEEDGNY